MLVYILFVFRDINRAASMLRTLLLAWRGNYMASRTGPRWSLEHFSPSFNTAVVKTAC
jgi:hypothetical protein